MSTFGLLTTIETTCHNSLQIANDQELISVQFYLTCLRLYLTVRLRRLKDPIHGVTSLRPSTMK